MKSAAEFVQVSFCPLCHSSTHKHRPFEIHIDHDQRVPYLHCSTCGLVFQSPRPSVDTLTEFYKADYRKRLDGSEEPTKKNWWAQARRADYAIRFIADEVRQVQNHLDVGSSLGLLLKAFSANYPCKTYGVEPGAAFRERGIQEGLEIVSSLSDLPASLRGSADIISLMHVLEHIPDPVEYLMDLATDWLKPEGFLLLEVPNLYAHPCYEFAHLIAFSPSRLREVARQAGYRLVKFRVHGYPYSRMLPLFILALFQKMPDEALRSGSIAPEHGVRLKRILGYGRTRLARSISPMLLRTAKLQPWEGEG